MGRKGGSREEGQRRGLHAGETRGIGWGSRSMAGGGHRGRGREKRGEKGPSLVAMAKGPYFILSCIGAGGGVAGHSPGRILSRKVT